MTDVLNEVQASAWESYSLLSAAFDENLWKQANEAKGHISHDAVREEYERLVVAKARYADAGV